MQSCSSNASVRRALKPCQPIQYQPFRRHAVSRGYLQLPVCAHTARVPDVIHVLDAASMVYHRTYYGLIIAILLRMSE